MDETLKLIQSRLENSHYFEVRKIKCVLRGENLVLSGKVSSFYMKQQAQEVAKSHSVNNEIEVVKN